jgi:GTP cyclohydrolase I
MGRLGLCGRVSGNLRGMHKPDTDLVTVRMLGCFRDNPLIRQEFLGMTV